MLGTIAVEKQEMQELAQDMLALVNGTWQDDPEIKKRILQRGRNFTEPPTSTEPAVCDLRGNFLDSSDNGKSRRLRKRVEDASALSDSDSSDDPDDPD